MEHYFDNLNPVEFAQVQLNLENKKELIKLLKENSKKHQKQIDETIIEEYITETELNAKGYLTSHQDISSKADISYVDNKVANLVDSAPEALNTLNELAAALKDDPNHTETMLAEIGKKANAWSPIYSRESGRCTSVILHPKKAHASILFTVEGIFILVKDEHPENAPSPMLVTLSFVGIMLFLQPAISVLLLVLIRQLL